MLAWAYSSTNRSMLSPAQVLVCLYMDLVDRKYSRTARLRTLQRQIPVLEESMSVIALLFSLSLPVASLTPCVQLPCTLQICRLSGIYPRITIYCKQYYCKKPAEYGELVEDISAFTERR
jgi:hypothetical protein